MGAQWLLASRDCATARRRVGFASEFGGTMRQLGDRLFSLVFLLLFSSCVVLAPTPTTTHVQYPVVAAFANRDDVLQGTIDNNLMTGTAYVEVVSDNDSLQCRGEAHLTDRGIGDSCAGGKGDCNLTCDNGESLLCKYQLQSCTSGFGARLDQGEKWFAFLAEVRVARWNSHRRLPQQAILIRCFRCCLNLYRQAVPNGRMTRDSNGWRFCGARLIAFTRTSRNLEAPPRARDLYATFARIAHMNRITSNESRRAIMISDSI
jgi:hypothetical protein